MRDPKPYILLHTKGEGEEYRYLSLKDVEYDVDIIQKFDLSDYDMKYLSELIGS